MSATAETLPVVFMFSGQGSQYPRMGRDLYEHDAAFRAVLDRYDDALRDELGGSVLAEVFDPARPGSAPFTDTRTTHPGIVMIELALAEILRAHGTEPAYLLGSSLGEYTSAVLAGVLEPIECLRLLVRQSAALATGPRGAMVAVLGDEAARARVPALRELDVAARNYPGHQVFSGTVEVVERAEAHMREAGVLHQRVPVEYAYHSRLMDEVRAACAMTFDGVTLRPPRLPWLSSVDGQLVERADPEFFWRVAREPIDFERAFAQMRTRGDFLYLDLGPSGTLHNFVRSSLPADSGSRSLPLLSPFGHGPDLLAAARSALAAGSSAPPSPSRKVRPIKVFGFPGQGSQQRGMGKDLFARYPRETELADEILGYSIEQLCLTDPDRTLARTDRTQPALYVVSALSYLDRLASDPEPPDYLVGHSLGEYVALFAAGVFDFETGLRLVQRRGALMAAAGDGGMAAVLGLGEAEVSRVLAEAGLDSLDIANDNTPDQLVLSGPGRDIDTACTAFEQAGARAVRLNVSAPFHSRYMRQTAREFARFLKGFTLREPAVPVLANVDTRPYPTTGLAELLTAQITSRVRWTDTIRSLMGAGELDFVELGPGRVLTRMVDKIVAAGNPLPPPRPRENPVAPSREELSPPAQPTTASAAAHRVHVGPPGAEEPDDTGLGAETFRERYGLRHGYVVGSMYGGISGPDLLRATSKAGLLGFLGVGGLDQSTVEHTLHQVVAELGTDAPIGVNLLYRHGAPEEELALVDSLLRHGIQLVEAAGFPLVTPALVKFRLKGGRILAKVSRTDTARRLLSPPPEHLVDELLASGHVTADEAAAAAAAPLAEDLCVQASGGWWATAGDTLTLLPAVLALRDELARPGHRVHVGYAGGIGTGAAAAAAYWIGADFVLTGSINQCTVEAATSDAVKAALAQAREFDVETAPWGPLFELDVRASYLKRGTLFPARAARLHELWRRHESIDELDPRTRDKVLTQFLGGARPAVTPDAAPKSQLAETFRGYFDRAWQLAVSGGAESTVDYLVHCGPAMGAFNQAVAGTELADHRARTIDAVADRVLTDAAQRLGQRMSGAR